MEALLEYNLKFSENLSILAQDLNVSSLENVLEESSLILNNIFLELDKLSDDLLVEEHQKFEQLKGDHSKNFFTILFTNFQLLLEINKKNDSLLNLSLLFLKSYNKLLKRFHFFFSLSFVESFIKILLSYIFEGLLMIMNTIRESNYFIEEKILNQDNNELNSLVLSNRNGINLLYFFLQRLIITLNYFRSKISPLIIELSNKFTLIFYGMVLRHNSWIEKKNIISIVFNFLLKFNTNSTSPILSNLSSPLSPKSTSPKDQSESGSAFYYHLINFSLIKSLSFSHIYQTNLSFLSIPSDSLDPTSPSLYYFKLYESYGLFCFIYEVLNISYCNLVQSTTYFENNLINFFQDCFLVLISSASHIILIDPIIFNSASYIDSNLQNTIKADSILTFFTDFSKQFILNLINIDHRYIKVYDWLGSISLSLCPELVSQHLKKHSKLIILISQKLFLELINSFSFQTQNILLNKLFNRFFILASISSLKSQYKELLKFSFSSFINNILSKNENIEKIDSYFFLKIKILVFICSIINLDEKNLIQNIIDKKDENYNILLTYLYDSSNDLFFTEYKQLPNEFIEYLVNNLSFLPSLFIYDNNKQKKKIILQIFSYFINSSSNLSNSNYFIKQNYFKFLFIELIIFSILNDERISEFLFQFLKDDNKNPYLLANSNNTLLFRYYQILTKQNNSLFSTFNQEIFSNPSNLIFKNLSEYNFMSLIDIGNNYITLKSIIQLLFFSLMPLKVKEIYQLNLSESFKIFSLFNTFFEILVDKIISQKTQDIEFIQIMQFEELFNILSKTFEFIFILLRKLIFSLNCSQSSSNSSSYLSLSTSSLSFSFTNLLEFKGTFDQLSQFHSNLLNKKSKICKISSNTVSFQILKINLLSYFDQFELFFINNLFSFLTFFKIPLKKLREISFMSSNILELLENFERYSTNHISSSSTSIKSLESNIIAYF